MTDDVDDLLDYALDHLRRPAHRAFVHVDPDTGRVDPYVGAAPWGPGDIDLAVALRAERAARQAAERDRDAYKALYDDLSEATGFVDGYDVGTAERSVIRRLLDGWGPTPKGDWCSWAGSSPDGDYEPMSDAERAVLAAVEDGPNVPTSPPTNSPE